MVQKVGSKLAHTKLLLRLNRILHILIGRPDTSDPFYHIKYFGLYKHDLVKYFWKQANARGFKKEDIGYSWSIFPTIPFNEWERPVSLIPFNMLECKLYYKRIDNAHTLHQSHDERLIHICIKRLIDMRFLYRKANSNIRALIVEDLILSLMFLDKSRANRFKVRDILARYGFSARNYDYFWYYKHISIDI